MLDHFPNGRFNIRMLKTIRDENKAHTRNMSDRAVSEWVCACVQKWASQETVPFRKSIIQSCYRSAHFYHCNVVLNRDSKFLRSNKNKVLFPSDIERAEPNTESSTERNENKPRKKAHARTQYGYFLWISLVCCCCGCFPSNPIINETEENGCESYIKHTQILSIAPTQMLR